MSPFFFAFFLASIYWLLAIGYWLLAIGAIRTLIRGFSPVALNH
ncbi:MAG: hypothetical protein ACRC64_06445 [Plesiomonas shigelloides]